jgi:Tfp pilus assembly protein PilE
MGQQQLLLVILVTVIVGIATVVAINTFSSASKAANRDAVTNDMVAIAASAQSYYIKPKMLNGGGNDFSDINFRLITFAGQVDASESAPLWAMNVNGTYVISGASATEFTLTGYPSSCDGYAGTIDIAEDGTVDLTKGDACDDANEVLSATVLPNNIQWVSGS